MAQRIGKPNEEKPRALSTIWNMDMVQPSIEDYQEAARKIRDIYIKAFSEIRQTKTDNVTSDDYINDFVYNLFKIHPSMSSLSFWRVLVTGLVAQLDAYLEGEEIKEVPKLHDDIMERLKES